MHIQDAFYFKIRGVWRHDGMRYAANDGNTPQVFVSLSSITQFPLNLNHYLNMQFTVNRLLKSISTCFRILCVTMVTIVGLILTSFLCQQRARECICAHNKLYSSITTTIMLSNHTYTIKFILNPHPQHLCCYCYCWIVLCIVDTLIFNTFAYFIGL